MSEHSLTINSSHPAANQTSQVGFLWAELPISYAFLKIYLKTAVIKTKTFPNTATTKRKNVV